MSVARNAAATDGSAAPYSGSKLYTLHSKLDEYEIFIHSSCLQSP